MSNLPTDIVDIEITQIVPDKVNLRESMENAKAQGAEFEELANSIFMNQKTRGRGLINPILLRHGYDENTGERVEGVWYLVDGMQRLSAYKKLNERHPGEGFDRIPAIVNDTLRTDEDVMIAQLTANVVRVKTTGAQIRKVVLRLSETPDPATGKKRSGKQLAAIFGWDPSRISQILKLRNLTDACKAAFENETVPANVMEQIARLPQVHQDDFLKLYLEGEDDDRKSIGVRIDQFLEKLKKDWQASPDAGPVFKCRPAKVINTLWGEIQEVGVDAHPFMKRTKIEILKWIGQIDDETLAEKQKKRGKKKLVQDAEAALQILEQAKDAEARLAELQAQIGALEAQQN
jgi:hypothetical protein